jgi:hypothetical protein
LGVATLLVLARGVCAQTADSAAVPRPFVPGGYDDKPYLSGLFGRIAVGGYLEMRAGWDRVDGITDELGITLDRWNLLAFTEVSKLVHVWSEVEFEDGGEEVRVELAQVDVLTHSAASLRAGVLLLPLGRYNLAHDGPRNDFTDRPHYATELLGVVLSDPGLGLFGRIPWGKDARVTYEAYGVNGYHDGIVLGSAEGTRLSRGRGNFEDQNQSPALVGRVAVSPMSGLEVGLSGYQGAWNVFRVEGLEVDERRDLGVGAVDFEAPLWTVRVRGEAAAVKVEVPPSLAGLYASRQAGFYVEAAQTLLRGVVGALPTSSVSLAVRVDVVDFDRDLDGDSDRRVTAALNVRPTPESVVRFDYTRGEVRDRFNNLERDASLRLGIATYF